MSGHGEVETELVNLSHCSLHELRTLDDDELAIVGQRVMRQVEKPRANLGSSGPPGRAD